MPLSLLIRPICLIILLLAPFSVHAADYPLDEVSRMTPSRGRVKCPDVDLVRYRGSQARYQSALTVNRYLVPRLDALEALVEELALKYYGRAPRRIEHMGSFNCRRIRGWPNYLSEHGLANAVDISGFRFSRARGEAAKTLPRHLRRGFRISVLLHWNAKGQQAVHACFLRELASEVMRRGLFRGVFGPGYPGHANHFHFDMSPWQMHEVDLSGPPQLCPSN